MQESSFQNCLRNCRSYVRREHRMTPGQARALKEWWPQYGLSSASGPLEFNQETILEIGFGMGHSLLAMAERYPQIYFIGVEVHRPGVGALLSAAARRGIKNLGVFNEDIYFVLNQSIKNDSLSKIEIFFPDPWPKNRHRKRRLIQANFIQLVTEKLKLGGCLHLATDWPDYAEQMLAVLSNAPGLRNCAEEGGYLSHRNERVVTKFEQRALNLERRVWDLLFMKSTDQSLPRK